jgi:hypothetical protein
MRGAQLLLSILYQLLVPSLLASHTAFESLSQPGSLAALQFLTKHYYSLSRSFHCLAKWLAVANRSASPTLGASLANPSTAFLNLYQAVCLPLTWHCRHWLRQWLTMPDRLTRFAAFPLTPLLTAAPKTLKLLIGPHYAMPKSFHASPPPAPPPAPAKTGEISWGVLPLRRTWIFCFFFPPFPRDSEGEVGVSQILKRAHRG